MSERETVKQEIIDKIEELQFMNSMSVVDGIMALELVKTFIKYMDEE